jgi:hypothetical protein
MYTSVFLFICLPLQFPIDYIPLQVKNKPHDEIAIRAGHGHE